MVSSLHHHSPSVPSLLASSLTHVPIHSSFLPTSSWATWIYTTLAIVVTLLVLEQSVYRYKKKHLPGAIWAIPVIGKFADSMKPTMKGYIAQWNSGALSIVSVFNIFIVMASTDEYSRKILNSPTYSEPCLVHSARSILMSDSWVFLTDKPHVEYRKVLNTIFTRKALGIYISIQDAIIRKHLNQWLADAAKDPSPRSIIKMARELNLYTSLRVFCGNHISEEGAVEIGQKYWNITRALELVKFPIPLPGTKVYNAIQARKAAFKWLGCRANVYARAVGQGNPGPGYKGRKDFSDREMELVVFSFLLASQDAMSSGLIYGLQHLSDNPELLAKIRAEQYRVRGNDVDKPLTLEMLEEMPYLRAFVKESVRVKPPVIMVPHRATKPFPITPDYAVPANSIVIPSLYNSSHDPEVYPDHDNLIPERWLDPNSPANSSPKNYLVFGYGPHKCLAIEYAQLNIALVLATTSVLTNWEHCVTPESDKVQIITTLFPKDGCLLKFTPRPKP